MNVETQDKVMEPRPLRRDDKPTPEDAELADLFRRVKPRGPLNELAVQRIRRGLEQRIGPGSSRRTRWIRTALAVAASLFLMETFAALAVSAWPASRRALMRTLLAPPHGPPSPAAVVPSPSPPAGEIAHSPSPPEGERVVMGPALAVTRSPSSPVGERVGVRGPLLRVPAPAAVPTERSIDEAEVAAYTGALAELNVRKDPAKALKMLEGYRAQYPSGLFHDEVAVAEVRADMALGHEPQALALLDGMQARGFPGLPQAGELALLRVELLGRANRCAEALPLLTDYLQPPSLPSPAGGGGSSPPPAQLEQLLFERGACDAQLGNLESSQQDLRDYLRQFPHGRYEADLRQRIARAVPAPE